MKRKNILMNVVSGVIGAVIGVSVARCTAYKRPESNSIYVTSASYITSKKDILSDKDRYSIARLVYTEAGAESELGQRLVIDTIFNRVDSEHFPDTVYDVIWQPGQFAAHQSIDNPVYKDILELVDEEYEERTNDEVVFFNSIGYTIYGEALFKECGHYFSKYKE